MAYWDTSSLYSLNLERRGVRLLCVKLHQAEAATIISHIGVYEIRATFQRKESEGILQSGAAQRLYSQLLQDIAASEIRLVELGAEVEREYGQVLTLCYQQNPAIPLRTLDALHLASARVAGETGRGRQADARRGESTQFFLVPVSRKRKSSVGRATSS